MHFVYKMDNFLGTIRVSDENSSVTPAITYFNKLVQLRTFICIQMHNSNPCHQLSTLSDIICYFRCIYWFVFRAKSPWKWKAVQNELWEGWNLARYHHFTRTACAKSRESDGKNWMHFVYKMDNLLGSIRVSDENSSVTPAIQYFNNLVQLWTFFAFRCTIQIHVINFQPFVT